MSCIDNIYNTNINYILAKKDIIKFYFAQKICPFKCKKIHDYMCLHNQIFELIRTVKPKYSDDIILNAFHELCEENQIFICERTSIQLFIDNNVISDMLKYLNNNFWILCTFKKNIRCKKDKFYFVDNMDSIFENCNDYNDTFLINNYNDK